MTYAAYLETDYCQYMVTTDTWEDVKFLIFRDLDPIESVRNGRTFVIENNQMRGDLGLMLEEAALEFIKQQENV